MFHVYRVGKKIYPVRLKGRAWISTDKFEVLRLETDLIEPLDVIRLQREHSSVEYAPIEFSNRNVRLWLPRLTELDIDLRGRHYERRHTFSKFQLFSVDTEQEIKGAHRQQ